MKQKLCKYCKDEFPDLTRGVCDVCVGAIRYNQFSLVRLARTKAGRDRLNRLARDIALIAERPRTNKELGMLDLETKP